MKQITNEEYLSKMKELQQLYELIEDVYHNHSITNDIRLIEIMKLVRELSRRVK